MNDNLEKEIELLKEKITGLDGKVSSLEEKIEINRNLGPAEKDALNEIINDRLGFSLWDNIVQVTTIFEGLSRMFSQGSGGLGVTSEGLTFDTSTGDVQVFIPQSPHTILKGDRLTFFTTILRASVVGNGSFILLPAGIPVGIGISGTTIIGTVLDYETGGRRDVTLVEDIQNLTGYTLEIVYHPGERADFFVDEVERGSLPITTEKGLPDENQILVMVANSEGTAGASWYVGYSNIIQVKNTNQ